MPNFDTMNTAELQFALKRAQAYLEDARDERSFTGKQTSMHIKVSELSRLDQDIKKFQAQVTQLETLIEAQAA